MMRRIPDYFEALIAYRVWLVKPNGLLTGQAVQEPWPFYQAMVGRCGGVREDAEDAHVGPEGEWRPSPAFLCDCGVHAVKTEAAAEQRWKGFLPGSGASYWGTYKPASLAWGSVKLWGRVIEHDEGYRAEFAYPYQLQCGGEQQAACIAERYGISCDYEKVEEKEENLWCGLFNSLHPPYYPSYALPKARLTVPMHRTPSPAPLVPSTLVAQVPPGVTPSAWQLQELKKARYTSAYGGDWQSIMRRAFHKVQNDPTAVDIPIIGLGG